MLLPADARRVTPPQTVSYPARVFLIPVLGALAAHCECLETAFYACPALPLARGSRRPSRSTRAGADPGAMRRHTCVAQV